MTKADAAKLVGIIVMAYPNYDKFKDENAVKATVELWAMMFKDDNAGVVGLATKKHIATNKWPPSIAEIRELMLEVTAPDLIQPDKAWMAVSDLMSAVGEYNHGDLYHQLPPLVARAVETIGWGNLWAMHCSYARGGKPGMDRVAFEHMYQPMYERERLRAMTPVEITGKIDEAAAKLSDGTIQMLEDIHQRKIEKDRYWDDIFQARLDANQRQLLEATYEEEANA